MEPSFGRAVAVLALALVAAPARADDVEQLRREIEQLKSTVRELADKVAAQDQQLRELRAASMPGQPAPVAPPPVTPPPVEPPAPPPASTGGGASSTYFNPSVSVIGNFLGVAGHNAVENLPNMDMREAEVGLQAIVDPYARGDFFLSFGEQGVDLEEGFVTFTALPWDLLAKVGRTRTVFGKVNTMHLHTLPWPDEPLPIVNLLGSEEGWIGTGVTVAKLLPIGDTFSELTLGASRGDVPGLFASARRSDIAYNAHYRLFRDVTESINADLGLSYGSGPNGTYTGARTTLEGVDLTARWKPLRTATYRSAILRGEWMRSRREQPLSTPDAEGWFLSGEYQLSKRWFAGLRFDSSDRPDDATLTDRGKALVLTFWPSEFSQLRGEWRRRTYADRTTADELLLQIQFAIGAHGAHPF